MCYNLADDNKMHQLWAKWKIMLWSFDIHKKDWVELNMWTQILMDYLEILGCVFGRAYLINLLKVHYWWTHSEKKIVKLKIVILLIYPFFYNYIP